MDLLSFLDLNKNSVKGFAVDFDKLILEISSRLSDVQEYKKSIVQADLEDLKAFIEDEIFKLRIAEHNYKKNTHPLLFQNNIEMREAIGVLFLSHLAYNLRNDLSYSSIWPAITENLEKYSRTTTFFKKHYLHANHANPFLTECIGKACNRFDLRNAYDNAEDEHYIRNTILLQIGLLNRFTNLNTWLSGYVNQITVRTLLNKEDENYSSSFAQGWRVLRKYRDRVINTSVAKSLLLQNVWFKELDLEKLLIASRKSLGTKFLSEDEVEHVFFLDKIFYQDRILHFQINAEDLYALKLEGNDYSVYVNGVYASKILRNDDRVLYLDRPIVIKDPIDFSVYLELKNEDGDVVYNEEVVLFDLHDQVVIFDDKGNIYKDFSKKLPSNRVFGMLFDSDLDCDAPNENQSDYFSGYVTLANNLSHDNNCTLSYDGEKLFSLNFTTSVQKPDWMDKLVVYAADARVDIGKEVEFHLKIFDSNDDEAVPVDLPDEASILRWTYAGGYVDDEKIEGFSAIIELEPELVCERKHSFMIKFKNNVYQRTVKSAIFDQAKIYHVFRRDKSGDIEAIERQDIVNYDDLIESKLHFALFNYQQSGATRYVKDKMKLYGKIKLNKKTQLTDFPKFGETLILSEHLYNDVGDVIFKVIRQGIVGKYQKNSKGIALRSVPEYLNDCEFIAINHGYEVQSLTKVQYEINGNTIVFNEDYLSVIMIYEGNYVGSFVQYEKIDFKKLPADENLFMNFYVGYLPLLILDKQLLIEWIRENFVFFFRIYFSNYYMTPQQQKVICNFDDVSAAIEHLLFDVTFSEEDAQYLLQEVVLNGWADKLIKMPTLLVYLLVLAKSQKYVTYFINMLPSDITEPSERDEQFIEVIVNGLLSHHDLNAIQKHNLKIAMHYKYKNFYLNEALKKIEG
jgi:hypothetical protein